MVYIIVKKSDREVRDNMRNAPAHYRRNPNVKGFARGFEEADEIQRNRGRDNPDTGLILVDDGGKADRELRERTIRDAGLGVRD